MINSLPKGIDQNGRINKILPIVIKSLVQLCLPKMEWYIKFLPSVIKQLVQEFQAKSIGQNVMIHLVPAKWNEITCTSMLPKSIGQNRMIHYVPDICDKKTCSSIVAWEVWSEWNDTLSSCQVYSNHLYKYVCERAFVRVDW